MNSVTATYENGILHLDTPLELPEHTRVQVYVQPVPVSEEVAAHRQRVHEALVAAGLSLPKPGHPSLSGLLTEQEREELANRIPPELSLSELIIEERRSADV